MKQLTKAEEQIMQALWETGPAFVKDIIEVMPEPKPHYNTVSTLVKILIEKGFVDFKAYGKSHQYFAVVTKDAYSHKTVNNIVKGYFDGSFSNMVSFFVKEKELSISELEKLVQKIKDTQKPKS
ncbi:putative transcriptional regulator [Chitinophaga niastensis]|uniref:Putative transcriptional regulator n=1 Tax=Chitinophaga niastensis TaxID=536980 RepID=A0A2P8HNB8_CHINA|nr:BlaI/MecI/CopY family transcriptional regulator [Chitinophaga niastensis]PSL47715.1 putative transcriptional regulator [Chitinophaga niastensis]